MIFEDCEIVMILIFKYIIPSNYCGLAIYPFIFLNSKHLLPNKIVLNHEKIHLQQQKELLWIFFFAWYLIEYLTRLMQFKDHHKAYKNISLKKKPIKMNII